MDQERNEANHFEGLTSASDVAVGGLATVWLKLGLGFAHNAVRVSSEVLQISARELADRFRSTAQWAEGFPKGGFRVATVLIEGGYVLASDGLTRIERGTMSAVGAFAQTTDDVRDVADRTLGRVVRGSVAANHAS